MPAYKIYVPSANTLHTCTRACCAMCECVDMYAPYTRSVLDCFRENTCATFTKLKVKSESVVDEKRMEFGGRRRRQHTAVPFFILTFSLSMRFILEFGCLFVRPLARPLNRSFVSFLPSTHCVRVRFSHLRQRFAYFLCWCRSISKRSTDLYMIFENGWKTKSTSIAYIQLIAFHNSFFM